MRVAEWVLSGHPDRLADRIAEGLVAAALTIDEDALVGIEVAVHRNAVFVDGRIAAGGPDSSSGRTAADIDVAAIVRQSYETAGYGGPWRPDPAALKLTTDLVLDPLSDEERGIRGVSDDQSITVGHASGGPETGYLPIEQHLARALAQSLDAVRLKHPDILGPDGKVLVRLVPDGRRAGGTGTGNLKDATATLRLSGVSLSVHHAGDAERIDVTRLAMQAIESFLEEQAEVPGLVLPARLADLAISINGAGPFALGGPLGDNGLSGKKLALDYYGPHVPLGGGALTGKDPHKVDKLGAIRARQIARHLVEAGLAREATVHLAWEPGAEALADAWIALDGEPMEPARAARWLSGYDLTIAGTFADLALARIDWPGLLPWGYFGREDLPWERWAPGATVRTANISDRQTERVQA